MPENPQIISDAHALKLAQIATRYYRMADEEAARITSSHVRCVLAAICDAGLDGILLTKENRHE